MTKIFQNKVMDVFAQGLELAWICALYKFYNNNNNNKTIRSFTYRDLGQQKLGLQTSLDQDRSRYINILVIVIQLLRSSVAPLLTVPRVRTELARRAISVAAPQTWNSLPPWRYTNVVLLLSTCTTFVISLWIILCLVLWLHVTEFNCVHFMMYYYNHRLLRLQGSTKS